MQLLYGKPCARKIERAIARRILRQSSGQAGIMRRKPSFARGYGRARPTLAVVLVGNNHASINYVERKGAVAQSIGCGFVVHSLPPRASQPRLIGLIKRLNKNKSVDGIIVQLPLPEKFNTEKVLATIVPAKDVDNLRGDSPFVSPSVQAIWHMLNHAGKPKKNTPILVVGHGRLIGKPLYAFLLKKGFTSVTVADKTTKNLSAICAKTDIVISAVGKPGLITRVKKGAIVIDAGAAPLRVKLRRGKAPLRVKLRRGKAPFQVKLRRGENGTKVIIKGDVDAARVARYAKIITPVPGGVGPLTVAYLFKNLLLAMTNPHTNQG